MSMGSPLERFGDPLFYQLDEVDVHPQTSELDSSQRVAVRNLSGMQKEAIVSSQPGASWRLASDEGDYLDGHDIAPCPLSFFTTGMVSSVMECLLQLADERNVEIDDIEITLDNFYTMKGSALRGDMTGGALAPEFTFTIQSDHDAESINALAYDAVSTSPVMGLVDGVHQSVFSLALNGNELDPDRVGPRDEPIETDPAHLFEDMARSQTPLESHLVRHTGRKTDPYQGDQSNYTAGQGSSLQEEQDRILHIQGRCIVEDNEVKRITQRLFSPQGSIFEYRAGSTGEDGESGQAPDPLSYAASGIAFCFMTQFGRYADIVGKQLDAYRIIQDTQFGEPATAMPVETHVFLESPEGEEFARTILDMSEQTCFLHALCRTDLQPDVSVELV